MFTKSNEIYSRIASLVNLDRVRKVRHFKLTSKGFMDLNVDFLRENVDGSYSIALSHYYVQNGDSMADPDMEVRIIPSMRMAEALTFQQDGSPLPIYRTVYQEKNDTVLCDPKAKLELNQFLLQWLKILHIQRFK